MAKGQKRSTKEPRKLKGAAGGEKKDAGPKYLRQGEGAQSVNINAMGPGKMR
jgi:hypothetical protein